MKIVLQDKKSCLFFNRDENWTADAAKAHVFPNSLNAINFVYANKLNDMQIIFRSEKEGSNQAVPVPNH
ncbi:MAG: hypothetical protein ACO1QB_02010 [Verrucomicrobiales bacterium]